MLSCFGLNSTMRFIARPIRCEALYAVFTLRIITDAFSILSARKVTTRRVAGGGYSSSLLLGFAAAPISSSSSVPEIPGHEKSPTSQSGRAEKWLEQAARREERISTLQSLHRLQQLTKNEAAELAGLLEKGRRFEEQYNRLAFTPEHIQFKERHNAVFAALTHYCSSSSSARSTDEAGGGGGSGGVDDSFFLTHDQNNLAQSSASSPSYQNPVNVFYLDGPDAGTTLALRAAGVSPSRCFVANRHEASCQELVNTGPLPKSNVVHASAAEALQWPLWRRKDSFLVVDGDGGANGANQAVPRQQQEHDDDDDGGVSDDEASEDNRGDNGGRFGGIEFGCFYFDGCGGFPPKLVEMVAAALGGGHSSRGNCRSAALSGSSGSFSDSRKRNPANHSAYKKRPPHHPLAIGFSLVGSSKNDVVDKELAVVQAVVKLAKEAGFARVVHALDDPARFGLNPATRKADAGTLTTWLVLEP